MFNVKSEIGVGSDDVSDGEEFSQGTPTKKDGTTLFSGEGFAISRTGRIRKKSAKLMEMESLEELENDPELQDERPPNNRNINNSNFLNNANNANVNKNVLMTTNQNIVNSTNQLLPSSGSGLTAPHIITFSQQQMFQHQKQLLTTQQNSNASQTQSTMFTSQKTPGNQLTAAAAPFVMSSRGSLPNNMININPRSAVPVSLSLVRSSGDFSGGGGGPQNTLFLARGRDPNLNRPQLLNRPQMQNIGMPPQRLILQSSQNTGFRPTGTGGIPLSRIINNTNENKNVGNFAPSLHNLTHTQEIRGIDLVGHMMANKPNENLSRTGIGAPNFSSARNHFMMAGKIKTTFAATTADDEKTLKEMEKSIEALPNSEQEEKILKDRKGKKTKKITAYTLWSQHHRKNVPAGLDFGQISKVLSEGWSNTDPKEKMVWKRKAKIMTDKLQASYREEELLLGLEDGSLTSSKKKKKGALTGNPSQLEAEFLKEQTRLINALSLAAYESEDEDINISGIEPINGAAHLKLLGECLLNLSDRLMNHSGQIAVQGSLSVLLDSLICSLGPLICLTEAFPGLRTLKHVTEYGKEGAYIIPDQTSQLHIKQEQVDDVEIKKEMTSEQMAIEKSADMENLTREIISADAAYQARSKQYARILDHIAFIMPGL